MSFDPSELEALMLRAKIVPTAGPEETTGGGRSSAVHLPLLQLPGNGRPIGQFAHELGQLLAEKDIFRRNGCAFTFDPSGKKLEPASPTWFRSWAEQHVCFFKMSPGQNRLSLAATMTDDSARVVLEAPQFLAHLREIERVHSCRMPILRRDGNVVLLQEGYDRESATYTLPGSAYPLDTTADDARRILERAYMEFPFQDDGGRSLAVAVASMLTVFGSALMPHGSTRPVFCYLGNAEGTGKTTAARVAAIAHGAVPVESAPSEETEWSKKLLSVAISGRPILLLDNLKGHLGSPALEAYTSASRFTGRMLGGNKEFTGEACATVLITGNELTVSPDMRRRCLFCDLFTHELRAEERKFVQRLDEPALLQLRPALLGACWALVRAWDAAGRPVASRINASFPSWCETIGGIVEHAGFTCPTAPAQLDGIGDTDTSDIQKLASLMKAEHAYMFGEIAKFCVEHGLFERCHSDMTGNRLGPVGTSTLSKRLKHFDGRSIAPGVYFRITGRGRARRFIASEK